MHEYQPSEESDSNNWDSKSDSKDPYVWVNFAMTTKEMLLTSKPIGLYFKSISILYNNYIYNNCDS